jgi:hypothetical protein
LIRQGDLLAAISEAEENLRRIKEKQPTGGKLHQ